MLAVGDEIETVCVFFFFGIFLNFNGVLPGNETAKFSFLIFSVRFSVRFIKIICISTCPID